MNKFFSTKKDAPLKIITLSGTENVTKNMTIYEYGDDILVVDCGIGFPDSEMLGVDVVIPDMTYLVENSHKIKGLVLTHGHEDHIGAVPYFLRNFPDVPIYAGKLVQGFLKEKLNEKQYKNLNPKFHLLDPAGGDLTAGVYKLAVFRVNHSVPESFGIAITTPQGRVLHMADYKVDWTPVLDKPIDLAKISALGEEGVLCLLSDTLGVNTRGYTQSERTLQATFDDFFESSDTRQILVTTISTNISRMYQIITSAVRFGRKVVLSGRSIEQSVRVARNLGYLPFADDVFVKEEDSQKYLQKDLVYIIAGCYGQEGSSLDRLSKSEHRNISLEDNALVIFSADPNPPGVLEDVERVMASLTLLGAEVIYSEIQGDLHVSGHGTRGDLAMIASIVHPKYFIPIGGTITKMRSYTNMVTDLGFDRTSVFELKEGDFVEFFNGEGERAGHLDVNQVFIDGSEVQGLSPVVIKDRGQLSDDGVFVIVIPISRETNTVIGKVDVITRGFVHVKTSKSLIGRSRDVVNKALDTTQGKVDDWGALKNRISKQVEKFLYKQTRRQPLIIVHAVYI